jgi:hypothetical protein
MGFRKRKICCLIETEKGAKSSLKNSYRPKMFAHSNKSKKNQFFFNFFADDFFALVFCSFFSGFEISINFSIFWEPYCIFLIFFIFALFENFEVKRGRNC